MIRRLLSCASLCLAFLVGCATTTRIEAADDVHALLLSIRDNDHAVFDAHVDRPALEAEIQSEIVARTRDSGLASPWKAVGVLLSGAVAHAAGRSLIQPDVFRALADYYGYRPDMKIPSVLALATVLSPQADGRVCVVTRKGGPCQATFAREGATWRLVRVNPDLVRIGQSR